MTPEQIGIIIGALGAIGSLAAAVAGWIESRKTTGITEQVQKQTNGEREKLIAENQKLRAVLRPYRDMVRFVRSDPAGAELLERYADQHRTVVRDHDVDDLEARLLKGGRDA